jgi:hypothetical protein
MGQLARNQRRCVPVVADTSVSEHRRSLHSIRMRLLDDVSNYILLTCDYDLIFGDEEFVCFYLRHFLDHEGWKGVQSNIG